MKQNNINIYYYVHGRPERGQDGVFPPLWAIVLNIFNLNKYKHFIDIMTLAYIYKLGN